MAGVLHRLGASLPKRLLAPSRGNELGHWEPLRLVRLNDQLLSEGGSQWDDWRRFDLNRLGDRYSYFRDTIASDIQVDFGESPLFVLKDPRNCRLLPLYADVTAQLGVGLRCVVVYRNAMEVADSLIVRNGFTSDYAKLLWARHVLDAEANSRGLKRVFVPFDALLNDFGGTCDKVSSALEIQWPISIDAASAEIEAFLRPEHKHHNNPIDEAVMTGEVGDLVRNIFANIKRLNRDPDDNEALGNLSLLRNELDQAGDVFSDITFSEFILRQKNSVRATGRLTKQLKEAHDLLKAANENASQLQEQVNLLKLRESQLESARSAAEIHAASIERSRNDILNSYSWKATRPFRQLRRLFRSASYKADI
jgi:hypothetical protein